MKIPDDMNKVIDSENKENAGKIENVIQDTLAF